MKKKFLYPEFSEVISSSNVATYGGLCSLASLDRKQLKEKVLQSPNFKQFLELEPCMREVIVGKSRSHSNLLSVNVEQ